MSKNMVKPLVLMLVAIIVAGLLGGGCYCTSAVRENEVGLVMADGVSVHKVVAPGRHGANFNYWSTFERVDCQAKVIDWEDPSLVTKDKQPIAFKVSLTVRRDCTEAGIRNMWRNYNDAARNDEALARLVTSRAPDAAKAVTTEFTLDEMLGVSSTEDTGRLVLANTFRTNLQSQLRNEEDDTSILVEAVNINDIGPSPAYLSALEEKAAAQVQTEVARERTKQLVEQLAQEVKQTDIDIEKARRQNLVNEEKSKAFEQSDRFYELERLKLLANVVGEQDKLFFIPEDTDLTLLLGGEGIVPITE